MTEHPKGTPERFFPHVCGSGPIDPRSLVTPTPSTRDPALVRVDPEAVARYVVDAPPNPPRANSPRARLARLRDENRRAIAEIDGATS